MRARMALALSGTAVELREVLLRDKPPSLREVSPKATVPVLITDEQQVLEESLDIMLWTLQDQQECFALGGGAAAQREFIESFDQQFKPYWISTNTTAQVPNRQPVITATSAQIGCNDLMQCCSPNLIC